MHLGLAENHLTIRSVIALRPILKNAKKFKVLSTLILDQNDLQDEGIKELANSLTERFQALSQDQSYAGVLWLPLTHLSISDVQMTDNGFKYLIQRFEAIYIQHGHRKVA